MRAYINKQTQAILIHVLEYYIECHKETNDQYILGVEKLLKTIPLYREKKANNIIDIKQTTFKWENSSK